MGSRAGINLASATNHLIRLGFGLLLAVTLVVAWSIQQPNAGTASEHAPTAFVPLTPARLLDTRDHPTIDGRFEHIGPLRAGSILRVDVAGRGGVPDHAAAVVLNVTAVDPDAPGYLTVWACGTPPPETSNVNHRDGEFVANAVLTDIDDNGQICITSHTTTDVVIDVSGYVPTDGAIEAIDPTRLVDTRDQNRRLTAGGTLEIDVIDHADVPADASAAILNITAIDPDGAGYLTAWACGTPPPETSNVNYLDGATIANTTLTAIGGDGKICISARTSTDIAVDLNGYVPDDATIDTVTPARLLDTRTEGATTDHQFLGIAPPDIDNTIQLDIAGRANVPTGATAAILNITAIDPAAPGYLTIWPCDEPQPIASSLNYLPGHYPTNTAFAKLDDDGRTCITSHTPTNLTIDITAYTTANVTPPPTTTTTTTSTSTTTLSPTTTTIAPTTTTTTAPTTTIPPTTTTTTSTTSTTSTTTTPPEPDCLQTDSHASETECDALVAFYDALDGPNWGDATGWTTAIDPCTWHGITCNTNGISEIGLMNNNLAGDVPAEIGRLTNLETIQLGYNQLTEIPPEIGNLTNLTNLNLPSNDLAELPPEIDSLTNLNLGGNDLTKLPPEIGNLTNLTNLNLDDNDLTELPPEVGNLTNLDGLRLRRNQLTELPPEIGNLTNLRYVYFDGNHLTELPPEIGNLTNLIYLKLVSNQLAELPPEIDSLTNLYYLNVSGNALIDLPNEIGSFTDLNYLFVDIVGSGGSLDVSDVFEPLWEVDNLWELHLDSARCLTVDHDSVADWLESLDPGWDSACG